MIKLDFVSTIPAEVSETRLQRVIKLTEQQTKLKLSGSIAVKFVDRAASRRYNRQFANSDYPTDVLSFAYNEAKTVDLPDTENNLGDVIICTPIATAQAKQHDISLEAEITLLLVHGILHILGFDHQKPAAKASFAQIQNAIMEELALPAREYFNDYHN